MYIHRDAVDIVVQAPAKLNLFFEVLDKRRDGYHEIETLMCPITLFDTVRFRAEPRDSIHFQLVVSFNRTGATDCAEERTIPEGRENLAVRAVELLRRHAERPLGGSLTLVKRIPAAAGMGGGSSDAAAALKAAYRAWKLDFPSRTLFQLASQLGSDVPFFLYGGPALCRGRGERMESIAPTGTMHFVVVRPPEGLATARVYAQCTVPAHPLSSQPMIEAFRKGSPGEAGRCVFNRLQSAALTLTPWIERLQRVFNASDCLGHGMSGSGTSYFGLCPHASAARRLARRIESLSVGSVYAVRNCF